MARGLSILVAAALALASCRSGTSWKGAELSYAEVQSIHPGATAASIVEAFGEPSRAERAPDGTVRVLDYAAMDGRGTRARLVLGFDERGILVSKKFTGQVVRPGP